MERKAWVQKRVALATEAKCRRRLEERLDCKAWVEKMLVLASKAKYRRR